MLGALTPTKQPQRVATMAIPTIPTVNFLSYNSTGMSAAKCQFLNNICNEFDMTYVSAQEHFKWS